MKVARVFMASAHGLQISGLSCDVLMSDTAPPDVQILKRMEVPFETVDVLSNDMLRSGLKEYSQVLHRWKRVVCVYTWRVSTHAIHCSALHLLQMRSVVGSTSGTSVLLALCACQLGCKGEHSEAFMNVQWPTFPQVYISGEFYGGCDIMLGARATSCLLYATNSACCIVRMRCVFMMVTVDVLWHPGMCVCPCPCPVGVRI